MHCYWFRVECRGHWRGARRHQPLQEGGKATQLCDRDLRWVGILVSWSLLLLALPITVLYMYKISLHIVTASIPSLSLSLQSKPLKRLNGAN